MKGEFDDGLGLLCGLASVEEAEEEEEEEQEDVEEDDEEYEKRETRKFCLDLLLCDNEVELDVFS